MKGLRIKQIIRKEKVNILVNGNQLPAYEGETVLAALIASGYKSLKRSAFLKKKRGALCGMGVCFECLVTIDGIPNKRACMCQVENKMEIAFDE
jgi:sarcosine oxidase subunit alpha